MDVEDAFAAIDGDDDYLKPSVVQERMPLILLLGAAGFTLLLFIGTFVWLQFPSESIEAELQAKRPQATMKVPPLWRSAHGSDTPSTEGHGDDAEKPGPHPKAKRKSAVLHPHPDPKLVEQTDIGMLPIIGADGRKPWRVYSRPFNVLEKRPRVAVVMTGMGVSFNGTESVVGVLPGEVSLAFAPFARKLKDWIDAARGAGHEVLLNLPMEPRDYPRSDPGPYALMSGLDAEQNRRRLDWVLSRMTGYIGVTNYMGDRFTSSEAAMRPVLHELQRRGLMFMDNTQSGLSVGPKISHRLKLPVATVDRIIDSTANRSSIDHELAEIERIAKSRGNAVALAHPYPVTVRRLQRWFAELDEKGLVLAPVSAVIAHPKPHN